MSRTFVSYTYKITYLTTYFFFFPTTHTNTSKVYRVEVPYGKFNTSISCTLNVHVVETVCKVCVQSKL